MRFGTQSQDPRIYGYKNMVLQGSYLLLELFLQLSSVTLILYGGFLSHRGTPSSHPFSIGIFPYHPATGVPPRLWKPPNHPSLEAAKA